MLPSSLVAFALFRICWLAPAPTIKDIVALEGATAVLRCPSSDTDHNFMFWQLPSTEKTIIGPGNAYDDHRYQYEILSGKLIIRNVHASVAGIYTCVSKSVHNDDIQIASVRLHPKKDWEIEFEEDTSVNILRIWIIFGFLVLFLCGGWLLYINWKHNVNPGELQILENDNDVEDDDSTEELFSTTHQTYRLSTIRPLKRTDDTSASTSSEHFPFRPLLSFSDE